MLAKDAKPILASDIEPLLRGDWKRQRFAVHHALAARLRGNLANDQASPDETAKKLMQMLGDEPENKVSQYEENQFGKKPVGKHDSIVEPDATDDAAVTKNGFVKDTDENDLSEKIMQLVAGKLSPEECAALQALLNGDDDEDDEVAEDDPPTFSGQPQVGGGKRPLSQKADIAGDKRKLPKQAAMDSFNRRFPEASRITGAASPQYNDGTPVHDRRLLGDTTPAPRRSAMDSAVRRPSQSFAERFPMAARIRSA
ncbi:MAG: hypothetical protein EPN75_05575 [Beijerinckiaceae bacterium]|nr:MAG: hypothetical protein EPN75_05575 [Beijerinckiaceae bacterium]